MTKAIKKTIAAKARSAECARMYCESVAEVRKLLDRLSNAAKDDFVSTFAKAENDRIHYGHVGDLDAMKVALRQLSDRVFNEGEYAPRRA